MLFDEKLIELPVVKAAEFRRQAAEHPNQRELRGDEVNDNAMKRQTMLVASVQGTSLASKLMFVFIRTRRRVEPVF